MAAVAAAGTAHASEAKLEERASARIELARNLLIEDAQSYKQAGRELLGIKALLGEVDATFDPIIADAHRAHKTALAQKAKVAGPLAEAERLIKAAMASYETEQERLQQEEERRRQLEAERQAAEQRERDIEHAEACGATAEEVKVMAEAPLEVAPVIVTRAVPRVAGISSSQNWKWEVTDKRKLDQFIATNPAYSNLTIPNATAIGGLTRSLKSAMNIPGIKVWPETSIAGRRS